jgi:hypothetical protein
MNATAIRRAGPRRLTDHPDTARDDPQHSTPGCPTRRHTWWTPALCLSRNRATGASAVRGHELNLAVPGIDESDLVHTDGLGGVGLEPEHTTKELDLGHGVPCGHADVVQGGGVAAPALRRISAAAA